MTQTSSTIPAAGPPPLDVALSLLGRPDPDELVPPQPQRVRPTTQAAPPAAPTAPTGAAVDWATVVLLRRLASERITDNVDLWHRDRGTAMPEVDRRMMGRSIIKAVVREHAEHLTAVGQAMWPLELERRYATAVEDATFGYGRLQPLFEIPDAENIEIHGFDSVMVQYGDGHREAHPPVADSDEELVEAIRFLGENSAPARAFDDAHPMMTLTLGDRFRLHAIGFGLSFRPSIIIRQHILTDVTLHDLVRGGMLPAQAGRLLHSAVLAHKSIVISGDQGAGKTTLLRALIAAIPPNERFGTLETDYELLTHLQPGRRNMLALQAKVGLGEQSNGRHLGEYTVADLIPEALRQNLSRLIVGEVRGSEAGAMFEAMQSGAGTMSTTHSHSATSTIDRLASRVAQGGVLSVAEALRQVAHNIGLIVHVKLVDDTWRGGVRRRYVSEIRELTGGIEADRPVTHVAFAAATEASREVFFPSERLMGELRPFDSAWGA